MRKLSFSSSALYFSVSFPLLFASEWLSNQVRRLLHMHSVNNKHTHTRYFAFFSPNSKTKKHKETHLASVTIRTQTWETLELQWVRVYFLWIHFCNSSIEQSATHFDRRLASLSVEELERHFKHACKLESTHHTRIIKTTSILMNIYTSVQKEKHA